MEINEKDRIENLNVQEEEVVDVQPERNFEIDDPEEMDLGEETQLESEVSVVKNYSLLSQEELLEELKNLVENSPVERIRRDVEAIKNAFYKTYRKDKDLLDNENEESEETKEIDPIEQEFKKFLTKYKAKRAEFIHDIESLKEKNYKQKLAIIEELKELISEEENLNLTFQKFHDIQNRWRGLGQVPQAHIKDLWETWHHNVEKFYDYVKINKELRDLDLRKNFEAKKELIEKAEALLESTAVAEAFAQLQSYHDLWREIGPVPREVKDELWDKFREVTLQINKKHQSYFDQLKEERLHNLKMKTDLCERVEKLNQNKYSSLKEWQKVSDEFLAILEEWKTIGFVPKKENSEVYARLKKSRDEFFAKRRDYYKQLKQGTNDNLKLKREMCDKAEALKNSDDWKETTELLVALQKQWKEAGPIPRKYSDSLWNKFREACDTFFNRKSEHFSAKDNQYGGNLKAKENLIKELEEFIAENNEESIGKLKEFRKRWNDIGFVPIKEKDKIQKRFFDILDKKYKDLKISDAERKVMRIKDKIESSGNKPDRAIRTERDKLFNRIIFLENEISLLENNIGFFANSKNAEAFITDVRKKITKTKEEINLLTEQIRLIDKEL